MYRVDDDMRLRFHLYAPRARFLDGRAGRPTEDGFASSSGRDGWFRRITEPMQLAIGEDPSYFGRSTAVRRRCRSASCGSTSPNSSIWLPTRRADRQVAPEAGLSPLRRDHGPSACRSLSTAAAGNRRPCRESPRPGPRLRILDRRHRVRQARGSRCAAPQVAAWAPVLLGSCSPSTGPRRCELASCSPKPVRIRAQARWRELRPSHPPIANYEIRIRVFGDRRCSSPETSEGC